MRDFFEFECANIISISRTMESAIEMLCGLDVYAANVAEIIAEIDASSSEVTEEIKLRCALLDSIARAVEGMRAGSDVIVISSDDEDARNPRCAKRTLHDVIASDDECAEPRECKRPRANMAAPRSNEPHMKEFGYVAGGARDTRRDALEKCERAYGYKRTASSLRLTLQSPRLTAYEIENIKDDLEWLEQTFKK